MIQNTSKPWSIVLPLPINFEKTGNLGFGLLFLMSLSTIFQLKCISWQSVLLVKETRVPGENHRPASSWLQL